MSKSTIAPNLERISFARVARLRAHLGSTSTAGADFLGFCARHEQLKDAGVEETKCQNERR